MGDRVVVIGGGSWGTTVAHLCAWHVPTTLHSRRPEVVDAINDRHENPRYLAGYSLHPELVATGDLEGAVADADVVVLGVPSRGYRNTLAEIRPHVQPGVPIVSLAKGLEPSTELRMTQVVAEDLPNHPVGLLTGPNLAKEVLDGFAAAAVVAFPDLAMAERVQPIFSSPFFRVYTSDDVIGCEMAGALKNVIAIASGMADGVGAGDNTRAMVITRGLAELTRLGVAMGGRPETFAGLAGMGDLVATCISPQSRNRYVGERIGQGLTVEEIIEEMDQVAEGIKTAKVVMSLADRYDIDLPISAEIHRCVAHGQTALEAYRGLVRTPAGTELSPG
ncbi:MAG: NAD(P)H-dependent glycerol-3-phosphate dehydrogenase [Actinomycetota bacterium]